MKYNNAVLHLLYLPRYIKLNEAIVVQVIKKAFVHSFLPHRFVWKGIIIDIVIAATECQLVNRIVSSIPELSRYYLWCCVHPRSFSDSDHKIQVWKTAWWSFRYS